MYSIRSPHRRCGAEPHDGIRAGDGGVQAGRCGSAGGVVVTAAGANSSDRRADLYGGLCGAGLLSSGVSDTDWRYVMKYVDEALASSSIGIDIVVQSTQPFGQNIGNFWYQVT